MTDEFTIDKIFGNDKYKYSINEATKDAFRQYTGDAYIGMNRVARSGKIVSFFGPLFTSKKEKARGVTRATKIQENAVNSTLVERIKDYFKTSSPFETRSRMILYRKIKTAKIQELREKGTLIDKGFTSTTMSPYIGVNISTVEDGYTVRLHLLPSIPYNLYPLEYLSSSKVEEEVLFDSDMKYYLCNTAHKMRVGKSSESCEDVLDCIFIPSKFSDLLENNKNEWFDRWCHIINAENKYIFTDIIPINCYHILDRHIFHFIKEIEYFIQKNIWETMIDNAGNPDMKIEPFVDTLISEYNSRFLTMYDFITSYQGIILNNMKTRCIEFAEKILKKNNFRYTRDWTAFISEKKLFNRRNGGAALQILADLNALLKAVDGPQYSSAGGFKKEIRKSIRNVNALIATQDGRA